MNILHIQKATGIAGSERHLETLITRLDRTKFNPTLLLLLEPGHLLVDFKERMTEMGIPIREIIIKSDIDLVCLWKVFQFVSKGDYDLVHTHLIHADLYGLVAAFFARVRIKISSRHNDNPFSKKISIALGPSMVVQTLQSYYCDL